VLHVGWIWLDLANVTSEFNRICVVTFTDTCRIVDSYRVVVSWKCKSEERNLCNVHGSEPRAGVTDQVRHITVCGFSQPVCGLLLVLLFWPEPHSLLVFISVFFTMSAVS